MDKEYKLKSIPGAEKGICPKCKTEDLDYDVAEFCEDSVFYRFSCNACGAEGREYYLLEFDEMWIRECVNT